jgi:hypothetical protein
MKFLFEFKSHAHLTVGRREFSRRRKFFATTNQLIRPDANNRVGVRETALISWTCLTPDTIELPSAVAFRGRGDWPASPEPSIGLSVVRNLGQPLSKVFIGVAPTDDWTTIPAYLRWGNWNDCPAVECHVAAMRTWRDRYGAELIGVSSDTLNVRVAAKPATREEALALARDQYIYCSDIVDQGADTYSTLATYLMANDWWYFWWD